MNQIEAEDIYLYHVQRTEALLNSMGNNPQAKNAVITNTYAALSQSDNAFLWFTLGTNVSSSVGKNLQIATQAIINSAGQADSANVVLENFSSGNQAIFKNIVPLFLTYESIGVEGIELLTNSDINNPFKNNSVLIAMKNYSLLQEQQALVAKSLGLSLNDPKVIAKLFADSVNIKLAHSVTMGIVIEEQNTVQDIYNDELVDIMLDPSLGWLGHQVKLDEIKILDKTFNFFDYVDNPADLDQRLKFAEVLLNAIDDAIGNGDFSKLQADALKMADHCLWIANPHTAPNAVGDINGVYWGPQADEYDKQVKDSIFAFLNDNQEDSTSPQNIATIISNDKFDPNLVFTGENKIVKMDVDPLAYFLAQNPNYEVIAHSITELWNSNDFFRTPIYGGTIFSNSAKPYLANSSYLVLYTDGDYQYYQPYGEVRGITFPFIYDKTTGIPLTMPIVDPLGHYNHASTIDTIYNNPNAFNTPSHINWYNPYWNQLVQQAKVEAINHYFKAITVDNFMNAVVAPLNNTVSSNYSNNKLENKIGDVLLNNSGQIDFSNISGNGSSNMVISQMHLANGTVLVNDHGHFVCMNCNDSTVAQIENAANTMLHII